MTPSTLKKKEYVEWNREGFIPGPDETEELLKKRIDFCKNLRTHLKKSSEIELPFDFDHESTNHALNEAFPLAEELYGIDPTWVPLFFSNHQLAPWHGGCAWIFQLNENAPTAAFLQLRATFHKKSSFLGIYDRKELIVHELAHVGRMSYHEPKYEEVLAYRSSPSKWRQWVGPIIQSSRESLLFILLLALILFADVALIFSGHDEALKFSWWLKSIPLACIGFGLFRLAFKHYKFSRCLKKLSSLCGETKADHLIYRLTDQELDEFAFMSEKNITLCIENKKKLSFRWEFLYEIYLK